jgi:hypothetical protein
MSAGLDDVRGDQTVLINVSRNRRTLAYATRGQGLNAGSIRRDSSERRHNKEREIMTKEEIIRDTWNSRADRSDLDEGFRRDIPIRDVCKWALREHYPSGGEPDHITFHNDGFVITGELAGTSLVVARKPPSFQSQSI